MDVGGRLRRLPVAAVTLFLAALFVLWSAGPAHAQDDNDDDDFVNGEIVVKLTPGTDATQFGAEYGADRADTLLGSANIHLLRVTDGEDTEDKAERMDNDAQRRVLYAEPNFITDAPEGNPRYRARSEGVPAPSSDPAPYSGQYAVEALDLPCAQGINKGANTTVAVLDTGAQLDHPVLSGSLVPGYDFAGDDASPADEPNGQDDDGDAEVDEMTGHGTHVAGIVHLAAPDAKIMPLRVLDSDGRGNVFVIAEAVQYAVRNGADVINMSLGSSQESELIGDVTEALTEDDDDDDDGDALEGVPPEGVVVAASAGNDDVETPQYPAADEGVISVTSVNQQEKKSEWANYGPAAPDSWVDIAAPGEDVYSAFPTSRYASWDGTSMAVPFVAGQAALARSLEPNMPVEASPGEPSVENTIKSTARPLDATNPDHAGKLGAGHADAGASVRKLRPGAGCAPQNQNAAPSITDTLPAPGSSTRDRTPTISVTVQDDATELTSSDIVVSVDGRRVTGFSYDGGRLNYTSKRLSRATHTVELTATNAQGARGTETWSFRIVRR